MSRCTASEPHSVARRNATKWGIGWLKKLFQVHQFQYETCVISYSYYIKKLSQKYFPKNGIIFIFIHQQMVERMKCNAQTGHYTAVFRIFCLANDYCMGKTVCLLLYCFINQVRALNQTHVDITVTRLHKRSLRGCLGGLAPQTSEHLHCKNVC